MDFVEPVGFDDKQLVAVGSGKQALIRDCEKVGAKAERQRLGSWLYIPSA